MIHIFIIWVYLSEFWQIHQLQMSNDSVIPLPAEISPRCSTYSRRQHRQIVFGIGKFSPNRCEPHIVYTRDPGSPKLRMVSWNIKTLAFRKSISTPLAHPDNKGLDPYKFVYWIWMWTKNPMKPLGAPNVPKGTVCDVAVGDKPTAKASRRNEGSHGLEPNLVGCNEFEFMSKGNMGIS